MERKKKIRKYIKFKETNGRRNKSKRKRKRNLFTK